MRYIPEVKKRFLPVENRVSICYEKYIKVRVLGKIGQEGGKGCPRGRSI